MKIHSCDSCSSIRRVGSLRIIWRPYDRRGCVGYAKDTRAAFQGDICLRCFKRKFPRKKK